MRITLDGGTPVPAPAVEPPSAPPTPQQLASRMVIEVYRATSGRAMERLHVDWVALKAGIVELEHRAAAIAFAVEAGLLEVIEGDFVCLTDQGRLLLR